MRRELSVPLGYRMETPLFPVPGDVMTAVTTASSHFLLRRKLPSGESGKYPLSSRCTSGCPEIGRRSANLQYFTCVECPDCGFKFNVWSTVLEQRYISGCGRRARVRGPHHQSSHSSPPSNRHVFDGGDTPQTVGLFGLFSHWEPDNG